MCKCTSARHSVYSHKIAAMIERVAAELMSFAFTSLSCTSYIGCGVYSNQLCYVNRLTVRYQQYVCVLHPTNTETGSTGHLLFIKCQQC